MYLVPDQSEKNFGTDLGEKKNPPVVHIFSKVSNFKFWWEKVPSFVPQPNKFLSVKISAQKQKKFLGLTFLTRGNNGYSL